MTYPESLLELGLKLLSPFTTAKAHHMMECMHCGHQWSATPISKVQTYKRTGKNGCPNCNKVKREQILTAKREAFLSNLPPHITILSHYDGKQAYSKTKVLFRNNKCGHEFECNPTYIITGRSECIICGANDRALKNKERNEIKHDEWAATKCDWEVYKSEVVMETRKSIKEYQHIINPNNERIGLAGEDGAHHYDHIFPKRVGFDMKIPASVIGHYTNIQVIPWEWNLHTKDHVKHIPDIIKPYIQEDNLQLLIQQIASCCGLHTVRSKYPNLYNHEASNTYVLFCPFQMYHQTSWRAKTTYTLSIQATLSAAYDNARVVIIFEDEVIRSPSIVESRLRHITKQANLPRIHARSCIIGDIETRECNKFLKGTHIQGPCKSPVRIGAKTVDGKLVAVMTFSPRRGSVGRTQNNSNEWELVRFSTTSDYIIPGIASRLLQAFRRSMPTVTLISFADKRWSDGSLYRTLGFTQLQDTKPSYWYIDHSGKRLHRSGFMKHSMASREGFNASLPEQDNVAIIYGFKRIFDCGSMKFEMRPIDLPSTEIGMTQCTTK